MEISRREVLTIPNGLTLIRALGVPLFLWLLLAQDLKGWSYLVLAIGAWTDYFDGKVARWLHQESKLGAAMDPTIDRLYIAATVVGLAIKHYIPWWMVFILAARDLYMVFLLGIYRRRTGGNFVVTFLGKAATFNLLYAFPFLLLSSKSAWGQFAHAFGWAFALWGIGLYLLAALDYSRIASTHMTDQSHQRRPRV
jgi:cardiolipin synthase